MRLSPLFSEFFFTNKQLDLAGIGRFTLADGGTIQFEQKAQIGESAALVTYIAEKTGRMKSLVAADIDSYLELARQFLNIGKPYLFEGIGTLSKNKFGQFDFVQINTANDNKESIAGKKDLTSTTENSLTGYDEILSPKKTRTPAAKKIANWLIVISGLLLAVFGGYLVYNQTKTKTPEALSTRVEPASVQQQTVKTDPVPDTMRTVKDTLTHVPALNTAPGVTNYKFIIEKARRTRAFNRYNLLKTNFINVQMDTKDSVLFNLYFILPATPADTTKKRDSLQRLYGTRQRTVIELN